MNEMYIEKYYKLKLLGIKKDQMPQYTRKQIEEIER